jgi:hypothetical protein
MGTTLTGTTPQDTYDSLIKVTDNGPISGTLKALSDGLGNDSTLSLSTTAASIAGTLAVTGNATFDTNTLFVDAANNRVGVGTTAPADALHLTSGNMRITSGAALIVPNTAIGSIRTFAGSANQFETASITFNTQNFVNRGEILFNTALDSGNTERMRITSAGNVGIGLSAPTQKLEIQDGSAGAAIKVSNTGGGSAQLAISSNATSVATLSFTNSLTLSGGVVSVSDGIKFPATQVASADANTLDDYEEGTWTMGVAFGGASVGVSYGANTGRYTKIGNQVTVTGYLSLLNKGSSTGTAVITGLPFAIGSGVTNFSALSAWLNTVTVTGGFQGYGDTSTTTINMQQLSVLGVTSSLTDASFANNSEVIISFTYFV